MVVSRVEPAVVGDCGGPGAFPAWCDHEDAAAQRVNGLG